MLTILGIRENMLRIVSEAMLTMLVISIAMLTILVISKAMLTRLVVREPCGQVDSQITQNMRANHSIRLCHVIVRKWNCC